MNDSLHLLYVISACRTGIMVRRCAALVHVPYTLFRENSHVQRAVTGARSQTRAR